MRAERAWRRWTSVVSCVVLSLALPVRAEESRWALLVGIDDYIDPGISDLTGSIADVEAIRDTLVKLARFPSKQVFLLTSGDEANAPTAGNIRNKLKFIAERADSDDLVYLHFSLHAVLDEETGKGYLLEHRTDPNEYRTDALPLDDVTAIVQGMVAAKRMLVLDGCRNDPERGRGDRDNRLDERFSRGIRIVPRETPPEAVSFSQVLLACSPGQRAYELPGLDRGLFSWALEEALKGGAAEKAGDGRVTLGRLQEYLTQRVPDLVALHLPNAEQVPELSAVPDAARDYLLVEVDPEARGAASMDLEGLAARPAGPVEDLEEQIFRKEGKVPTISITQAPSAPMTRAEARRVTMRYVSDVDRGVKGYRWRLNDGPLTETARVVADLSIPEPGTHTFQVQVQDWWGNWSAPAKAEFTVLANRRPDLAWDLPVEGDTIEGLGIEVQLSGEDSDGSVVAYRLALNDPDDFQENDTGRFSLDEVPDGPHTLFAQSIDDENLASLWQTMEVTFHWNEDAPAQPAATGSVARRTSPGAAEWTAGQPAPEIRGLRLVSGDGPGLPEYALALSDDVALSLVLVPAGSFLLGSPDDEPYRSGEEGPRHEVSVEAFLIGKTEVTQREWEVVMGSRPAAFPKAGPDAPVESVSWQDLQPFLDRTGLSLPTEAQWEYAARAGTTSAIYAGELAIRGTYHGAALDSIAWYGGNSGVSYEGGRDSSGWGGGKQKDHKRAGTHPVAGKEPNAFGLRDMLGNVDEWCEDNWRGDYGPAVGADGVFRDPQSTDRVVRGGSWRSTARATRSASRLAMDMADRSDAIGFRVTRTLGAATRVPGAVAESERLPAERRTQPAVTGGGGLPGGEGGGGGLPSAGGALASSRGTTLDPVPAEAPARLEPPVVEAAVPPHKWTPGAPAPQVEGLTLVGLNAAGLPEYDLPLGPGVTLRLVLIPAGSFEMGSPDDDRLAPDSERPQHRVKLDAFLLARTEVTQRQWQAVMGANPARNAAGGPQAPVESVSWDDVRQFESETGLALPSEAQWEYACRAGKAGVAPGYLASAWYAENSGKTSHEVATLEPNGFGLYDMFGNVWELCEDTWHDDYDDAPTDGTPWIDASDNQRIMRGGGFINGAALCRPAYRGKADQGKRQATVGFRPVLHLR